MSNAVWSYRQMLRGTPASFFVMAAGVPLGVLLAWAELRLPALVVGLLQDHFGGPGEPLSLLSDQLPGGEEHGDVLSDL